MVRYQYLINLLCQGTVHLTGDNFTCQRSGDNHRYSASIIGLENVHVHTIGRRILMILLSFFLRDVFGINIMVIFLSNFTGNRLLSLAVLFWCFSSRLIKKEWILLIHERFEEVWNSLIVIIDDCFCIFYKTMR